MANYKQDEEMSMEDILSSIRKYVSEGEASTLPSSDDQSSGTSTDFHDYDCANTNQNSYSEENGNVISLGMEDIAEKTDDVVLPPKQNISEDAYTSGSIRDLSAENDTGNSNYSHEYKTNNETRGNGSPFNKLAEALKTYGARKKNTELNIKMSVEQFFRTVTENYLQRWMDANLKKVVDEIVRKEIEKLKQE